VGETLDGDLVLAGVADAQAAESLSEVTGSVIVLPSYEGPLALANLTRVGGSVRVEAVLIENATEYDYPRVTDLALPNLETIGDELYLYLATSLVEADFRALIEVGTQVYVHRNVALRVLRLDSFEQGGVLITANLLPQCAIDAVCAQVGGQSCGNSLSPEGCACIPRCGRLEPDC